MRDFFRLNAGPDRIFCALCIYSSVLSTFSALRIFHNILCVIIYIVIAALFHPVFWTYTLCSEKNTRSHFLSYLRE